MFGCTIVTRKPLFEEDAKAFEAKELLLLDQSGECLLMDEEEEESDRYWYTIQPKVYWSSATVLKRIRDVLGKDLIYVEWIRPDANELYVDCYIDDRKELKPGLKRLREILGRKNFIVCVDTYAEYTERYDLDTPKGYVARILLLGLTGREYEFTRGPVLEYAAREAFGRHSFVATHTHVQ